jgi:bacteriocin-like protein
LLFLKEKTMEKNSKIEQQLSEEDLQEITGGCLACEADRLSAIFAMRESHAHIRAADRAAGVAQSSNDAAITQYHTIIAQEHRAQAAQFHSQAQGFYQNILGRGQH